MWVSVHRMDQLCERRWGSIGFRFRSTRSSRVARQSLLASLECVLAAAMNVTRAGHGAGCDPFEFHVLQGAARSLSRSSLRGDVGLAVKLPKQLRGNLQEFRTGRHLATRGGSGACTPPFRTTPLLLISSGNRSGTHLRYRSRVDSVVSAEQHTSRLWQGVRMKHSLWVPGASWLVLSAPNAASIYLLTTIDNPAADASNGQRTRAYRMNDAGHVVVEFGRTDSGIRVERLSRSMFRAQVRHGASASTTRLNCWELFRCNWRVRISVGVRNIHCH
jgi:hypothetical protein